MTRWSRRHLAGRLAALALLACTAAAHPSGGLVGASSDDHLWIIVDRDAADGKVELVHHARTATGPYASGMRSLPTSPLTMAAWGDRLWMIFAPRDRTDEREVYTVQIARHAVQERYYLDRDYRLEPSLPAEGEIAAFVASDRGPVALLVPRAVRTAPGSTPSATSPSVPPARLLYLEQRTWVDVPLPEDFVASSHSKLAATGPDGTRLLLLDASRRGRGLLMLEGGVWTRHPLPPIHEGGRPVDLIRVDGRAMAVLQESIDGARRLRLAFVRPEQQLEIAQFDAPAGSWNVFGLRDGPRIVSYRPREGLRMSRVDPFSGEISVPEVLDDPPFDTQSMLRGPALFFIALFVLVMITWLRPASRTAIELPAGLALLPPPARIGALLIDMLPAGIIAMIVTGSGPAELLGVPLVATDPLAYAIMATLTSLHTGVTEGITGTSLGKRLLGARIESTEDALTLPRSLLRVFVKWITLLFPPLAIIVITNPNLQGLHDRAARTVVVHPIPDGDDDAADDA